MARSIHFTLFLTSLQQPPLYDGQNILPQGGRCREIQLSIDLQFIPPPPPPPPSRRRRNPGRKLM